MSVVTLQNQILNKVLLIIPCFLLFSCAQKQSSLKIPGVKFSKTKIKNIQFELDTVEKFKPISRNSILTTDSKGTPRFFALSDGIEVTLNGTKWEIIKNFDPFNRGVINSNIVHSNLINDSLVYFLYQEELWKFNTIMYSFNRIEIFKGKIKTSDGTLYHNWQDCYNQSPGIVYSKLNNTLYFPIFSYSKKGNKNFIGSYNLTNKKIDVINLERPNVDELIQRSVQDNTMFIVESNKIYFAFGFSKLGLAYDIFNKLIDTINLQSISDTIPQIAYTEKNTGIKSSSDRLIKTIIYNARYEYFTYNPFKQHYYKIFDKYLEEDNKSDGLKNTLNEKEVILQVFDKNLQLIKEISLPRSYHYISMVIINKDGILLFEPTDVDFIKGNPNKMQMLKISYE